MLKGALEETLTEAREEALAEALEEALAEAREEALAKALEEVRGSRTLLNKKSGHFSADCIKSLRTVLFFVEKCPLFIALILLLR